MNNTNTDKNNNTHSIELDIEGMDCPACAMKIEKTVAKIHGIEEIKVNLGSESASIKFKDGVSIDNVKSAIGKLGYKAYEPENDEAEEAAEQERKSALKRMRRKIVVSIILSLIVGGLGMKEHISFLSGIPDILANWISLPISTVVVFWCGSKFLKGFWIALKNKTADMDSLIAIGTLSAYIYSLATMLFPVINGEHNHTVYFESAAMIITFILLGNYLEANLKNKTQYAIKSLMSLQSKFATVLRNDEELQVPINKVRKGDIVIVKPGEHIPVDGTVTEGLSTVDEAMITGESIPNEKVKDSQVTGGTINLNGYLKIKVDRVGKETFLSKIINLVKDAQKSKPKIQRLGDKVAAVFVPVVILIALTTFLIWYFPINQTFGYALLKAVAVLIIACPCALGLATPIAVVLGVGRAAENKILFNNAEAIENVNKVDTVVFDKTGTLTYGKFEVTDVITANSIKDSNEILRLAASIENYSEHPIARAIVEHFKGIQGKNGNEELYKVDDFRITSGIGVEARIGECLFKIGGANLIKDQFEKELGNKPDLNNIYLFENDELIGEIKINDRIKENASSLIEKLKEQHYNVSVISGDSKYTTERIAKELNINDYHYEVLPDKKQEIIEKMQKEGKNVAMIGDGINDAPSLSRADIGIAIGTGQDIAIKSADVILVKGELDNVLALLQISKKTIRIIKQNLFWAFFYNAAAIPLAAGVLVPWGISISPVMASMFMALSDVVTVLGNSLRLKYMELK
jgi:P-type Cu+ transporter